MNVSDLFDQSPSVGTTIACDLSALEDPERHERESEALWDEREELRQVRGGVAIRFPGSMDYAERILAFIRRERRCCPFLTFELVFEPEDRGIWLAMTGDERVEKYLSVQFAGRDPLHEE